MYGYASPLYLESLKEFGEPLHLSGAGAGVLIRPIGGSALRDAMGAYPLFTCRDYGALADELAELPADVLTVAVVPDPCSDVTSTTLQSCFQFVQPFKTHYLADVDRFESQLRRQHRRGIRQALQAIDVEHAEDPVQYVDEWHGLYRLLCLRHDIRGLRAFSARAFALQLAVPGCHYFRALHAGEVVGALICYQDGTMAYAHLIATTPLGQTLRAQYALYWFALRHFRGNARWLNLGSVPGPGTSSQSEGIGFFKTGWASDTRQAYFCGSIRNEALYEELCVASGTGSSSHFPAYRAGEFFTEPEAAPHDDVTS